MRQFLLFWVVLPLCVASLTGCGRDEYGDLGVVQGVVTLDGEPYSHAMIVFSPQGGERPSQGITDEAGNYELIYIRTTRGALLGDHKVRISTIPRMPEDGTANLRDRPKELIPPRFNKQTELIRTVQSGKNTFDFDLTTK
ncbi:MAG: carboxypeptidase regulatory-like domain-containing protein [Pirellulaceae bacterium]